MTDKDKDDDKRPHRDEDRKTDRDHYHDHDRDHDHDHDKDRDGSRGGGKGDSGGGESGGNGGKGGGGGKGGSGGEAGGDGSYKGPTATPFLVIPSAPGDTGARPIAADQAVMNGSIQAAILNPTVATGWTDYEVQLTCVVADLGAVGCAAGLGAFYVGDQYSIWNAGHEGLTAAQVKANSKLIGYASFQVPPGGTATVACRKLWKPGSTGAAQKGVLVQVYDLFTDRMSAPFDAINDRHVGRNDQLMDPLVFPSPVDRIWVNASGNPLVRLTASLHDWSSPVSALPSDAGMLVRSLTLTIQTGSDDLRAGTGPNDNADAILTLQSGHTLDITNINGSQRWNNNETHSVPLAIPAGTKSGDIVSLTIHTQFGAGGGLISADNWNINQVTLQAVLQ